MFCRGRQRSHLAFFLAFILLLLYLSVQYSLSCNGLSEYMSNIKHETSVKSPLGPKDAGSEVAYLRSKVSDLSSLIEISIIINSTLDLDELIALVMEKAQSVMKAEASSVMLIQEETDILECTVALGEVGDEVKKIQLKVGEGIAGWVALHGKPQIVPDVMKDPRFSSRADDSTGFQTHSILAAPLIVKDRTIGVAEVLNRVDGKVFDDSDLELFSTFCRQVAMTIENARVHQLQLEKQKLEQELESAKIIQQSFMPEVFPDNEAYSIAAKSLAATSVGGDFFDFIEFDGETVGIAVGDVTGKGVPAALYMARVVSDFRLYTQIDNEPGALLQSLNKLLVERSRRGMFVTFQYGVLNFKNGLFTYGNAGHLPFIHINKKTNNIDFLQGGKSIPLGIAPEFSVQPSSAQLNKGDYVVLITDGIVEAKNKQGEAYAFKRTLEVLAEDAKNADDVVEHLLHDVQAFSKGTNQHDDLTILALKWH